jgi:predicted nucleic acid-binding protein
MKFENQDFDAFSAQRASAAFTELREQFGQYFDKIDDVDAWVAAVRRGDI